MRKLCLVSILTILVVALMASTAAAKPWVANEEQLKLLNELKGSKITYGEMIETVFPDAVKEISPAVKEQMDKRLVDWGDTIDGETNFTSEITGDNGKRSIPYDVRSYYGLRLHKDLNSIFHEAGSEVLLPFPGTPIPAMYVDGRLEHRTHGYVNWIFDWGEYCSEVNASSFYVNPYPGDYRAFGSFWGTFPPGAEPPTYAAWGETNWATW